MLSPQEKRVLNRILLYPVLIPVYFIGSMLSLVYGALLEVILETIGGYSLEVSDLQIMLCVIFMFYCLISAFVCIFRLVTARNNPVYQNILKEMVGLGYEPDPHMPLADQVKELLYIAEEPVPKKRTACRILLIEILVMTIAAAVSYGKTSVENRQIAGKLEEPLMKLADTFAEAETVYIYGLEPEQAGYYYIDVEYTDYSSGSYCANPLIYLNEDGQIGEISYYCYLDPDESFEEQVYQAALDLAHTVDLIEKAGFVPAYPELYVDALMEQAFIDRLLAGGMYTEIEFEADFENGHSLYRRFSTCEESEMSDYSAPWIYWCAED